MQRNAGTNAHTQNNKKAVDRSWGSQVVESPVSISMSEELKKVILKELKDSLRMIFIKYQ